MDKYVRVAWPESQEWIGCEDCVVCGLPEIDGADCFVFVPEELYNKVNNE